ncbi:thioredoxin domain-containing protein [Oceanobacillus sp. 1P07AA]|uniref:thioredoxin domain-containing protein n=1 Tax=Oceanobacillus sp. 1P07AA TaxID=3132293 RepID=UPI0039A417DE
MQSSEHHNHLINETSPYLQQHVNNPVDWYPWGEEAFNKAKNEQKPIFLSIGYSSCTWCHNMNRESFMDEEVAGLLNQHYISIKVDREERPDIDGIYMKTCQMMTGHGGWPLTIIMNFEQVPFFAGTYFPKNQNYGLPGLMDILPTIANKYDKHPQQIAEYMEKVDYALKETLSKKSNISLTSEDTVRTYKQLTEVFDYQYGGFHKEPKFPSPHHLSFLIHYYHVTGDKNALKMTDMALKSMFQSATWDHVGFGFFRYATDRKWMFPHFEKMLYDQAFLLDVCVDMFLITKDPYYQLKVDQIIQFVKREMSAEDGCFHASLSAESNGGEGAYYLWSIEEIYSLLGEDDGDMFAEAYGITPVGLYQGKNLPYQRGISIDSLASTYGIDAENIKRTLNTSLYKLQKAREQRIAPAADDKILTSWNGYMIAALAKAGRVFQEENWINHALKAMDQLKKSLIKNNRWFASYRSGEKRTKGFLDDYAAILWAYLELHQATMEIDLLKNAKTLANEMIELFWDSDEGGFFFVANDAEQLLSREKEIYDSPIPSGNSLASIQLSRLANLTENMIYYQYIDTMMYTFYRELHNEPSGASFFMRNLFLQQDKMKQVIIIGEDTDVFFNHLRKSYLPNLHIISVKDSNTLAKLLPNGKSYKKINGKTTYYVCNNFHCNQPTTSIQEALAEIHTESK